MTAPGDAGGDPVRLLDREARSLVARLRLWTPARWQAQAPPWGSRADLARHLAGSFVSLAGETRVPLPRLDSPLAVPDQLAVTADDLVRTGPAAGPAVAAVAHLLLHRRDLLGEDVPVGLAAALGLQDVLAAGRAACPGTPTAGAP